MAKKHLYTIICDDIRHERGNKSSLMGIYNDILLVQQIPHTMRLSVHQSWSGLPDTGKMKIGFKGPAMNLPILQVEYTTHQIEDFPNKTHNFSLSFNQLHFTQEGEYKIISFFGDNENDPDYIHKFYVRRASGNLNDL